MNKSTIIETFRWALKQKVTTVLIISGMTVGITVTLLIGLWGMHEFSFDKFHTNADQIYRVCRKVNMNGGVIKIGSDFKPVGETAKQKFPEIKDECGVVKIGRRPIKIRDKSYNEDKIGAVSQNFFQFFSFKLASGTAETCLNAPDKVVVSSQFAAVYFPKQNPLGQIIEIDGVQLVVSAVMENMPENSQLKFSVIVPFDAMSWLKNSSWGSNDSFVTYLLVNDGTDIEKLGQDITTMTYENFSRYEDFKVSHFLQPFTDIHFSSGFRFDSVNTSDRRIVIIFITLAVLILLIASFNFVNLFISTSFLRAKSIGIKKINGSSKLNLLLSSYLETGLYIFIATIIAIFLSIVLLPVFNDFSGTHLKINYTSYQLYLFIASLFATIVLIAGTIPVIYIFRFNPVSIIRNRFKGNGITLLQRALIISQFAASIMLICSAGIIKKQLDYIKNKDLGFNKEQVIYISTSQMAKKYDAIRNELLSNPHVLDVTAKNCLPTDWNNGNDVSLADNSSVTKLMEKCGVKENYFDMMQMPLVEGRNPFEVGKENAGYCLINEQAVKSLGLTDPVGRQIKISDNIYTVEGIIKDANTKSLHSKVDPQVYTYLYKMWSSNPILVKTDGNVKSVIKSLETIWVKYNPDVPFEYHFLGETYDELYKTEERASKIIYIGMIVAFFLSFMGLYAVSHYATERRVKEIGVRKVNGATISEILILLNRNFMRWIVISVVIATPITWFFLHKWLENFAYKTALTWWIFVSAGILAMGIALLTVSWQSWRAARRNPVESLKDE